MPIQIMDKQIIIYCACGCGKQLSKPGNRYILGHHRKGTYHTQVTLKKMRKNNAMHRPELREKIGIANKGKKRTDEAKEKMSKAHLGMKCAKETKEKMSRASIGNQNALGKSHSKEAKRKRVLACLIRWQNPEYREKQLKAIFTNRNNISPNKPERRLRNGLNKMFPGEYKFVGDGSILIGYKNPDFININGQKKIIEMFGDFWHGEEFTGRAKQQEENRRINHFTKYGFRTLIIWESELKSIKQLKRKLVEFHNE